MSTSMREALKPCPFCGSKSLTLTVNEHHWKIVECDDCGMRGPCIDLEDDEYLARWNTRAALSSPTPDRLSEEERAFLARMKKTPLKDIDRGDRCMMIDIIDRLSRQPEAEPVAWLRDLQPDAEDEALAVCNRIDPGAFAVYTSLRLDRERLARTLYRRLVLNPPADFDDASADLQNEWLQLADAIMRETR